MRDDQIPGVAELEKLAAELEKLAAELDAGDFEAQLVAARWGRWPCLRVRNRRAGRLSEQVYAGADYFWWSWAERIGALTDVAAAATVIARVLADRRDQR